MVRAVHRAGNMHSLLPPSLSQHVLGEISIPSVENVALMARLDPKFDYHRVPTVGPLSHGKWC